MPGQDRTGPLGEGPLTGRGLGPCGAGLGRGRGLGRGMRSFGRGFAWTRYPAQASASLTKAEEKKILESELKEIDLEKQEIEKRLKELK